jgi:transglutaminase-like putative cysteine protease
MILRSTHTTTFWYSEPVQLCHNLFHLTARNRPGQVCRSSVLEVSPSPAVLVERTDAFGNPTTFATVQEPHREPRVTAFNEAEVRPPGPAGPAATPSWDTIVDRLDRDRVPEVLDANRYRLDSHYVRRRAELLAFAAPAFPPGRPLLEAALDLMDRIHREFRYDPSATTIATPLSEVLALRQGVCQDFAHLQIACLRSLGLAARYVSGYLITTPAPGNPHLVGADDSHAWLSVWCPGPGWIDLDPTNNLIPADQRLTLAWGRDYDDVSPIKGVILGGGQHTVNVGVGLIGVEC